MLSLGASSLLGPPEDLSTVEELQGRLPLHPNYYSQRLALYGGGRRGCAVYWEIPSDSQTSATWLPLTLPLWLFPKDSNEK